MKFSTTNMLKRLHLNHLTIFLKNISPKNLHISNHIITFVPENNSN